MSSDNNGHPQAADLDFVRDYVANLKRAAWLQCRENRHAFPDRAVVTPVDENDDSVVERAKRCRRCGTRRIEVVSIANGMARRIGVRYENRPEGYLMEPGHGRLDSEGLAVIRYENIYQELAQQRGRS